MPSPVEDQPGLLIRDSYGYSDAILIIPPALVACLECFDGLQNDLDLRARLTQVTGELEVSPLANHLSETLQQAGFLQDETFEQMKQERHREFQASPVLHAAHAGSAYPADAESTKLTLGEYMKGSDSVEAADLIGIAAPHVSPFGGWQTYRAAYGALGESHRDRTFVVLGTSHYGEPQRFGLTRKPVVTPLGQTLPDLRLIEELASEPASKMEDYCHAIEHSIEFQILFLQYLYGPDIRVLPVLCGSFYKSLTEGGKPEEDEGVRSFLGRLGEINAREGRKLLWVLGIDMAHMGRRYGDSLPAKAGEGSMEEVARRDGERIEQVNVGDAAGFWSLVQENGDDLKWCGSSPLYTFLKAVPEARGKLRGYEQWNIDESSVVSFGAMAFNRD